MNLTLESHISYVGVKSYTLQLDPNTIKSSKKILNFLIFEECDLKCHEFLSMIF